MDAGVVGEVIKESGPVGGMLLMLFFYLRDRFNKIDAQYEKHEKQLNEQSARILHIEKSTTTQPIIIAPEGGAT